jgi:hypothetical protein
VFELFCADHRYNAVCFWAFAEQAIPHSDGADRRYFIFAVGLAFEPGS